MSNRVFIVDLDGTLYFQFPVRLMMALEIFGYYAFHPLRWRDVLIIWRFRQYHEQDRTLDFTQFSQKNNWDEAYVRERIEEWMVRRPLKWIKLFADRKLISVLKHKDVIVYSDYPTEKKLQALSFQPMAQYYCDNERIRKHKPDTEGLVYISMVHNIPKAQMCVIGDRPSHDGVSAQDFGCDCLILSGNILRRQKQYKDIK